ncbi:MAG: ATP-binding cassette domain-containing protein [Chloroflexota bacterium]
MREPNKIIEMKGISKSFGSVQALEDVDFDLYEGEVLALLGDNGAGKSTLIKIISGLFPYDSGEMTVFGQKVNFRSPQDAQAMGIETIYQDLALFDNLDVMANIFAGRELRAKGLGRLLNLADRKQMYQEARQVLDRLGINIVDYYQDAKNFSGGQRQSMAIAKAIHWGHRIIIMDEPTAALGVRETEHLFRLIQELKSQGVSLLVIMHNIEQVMQIAERAIVLRRGRRVGGVNICEFGPGCYEEIVKMLM